MLRVADRDAAVAFWEGRGAQVISPDGPGAKFVGFGAYRDTEHFALELAQVSPDSTTKLVNSAVSYIGLSMLLPQQPSDAEDTDIPDDPLARFLAARAAKPWSMQDASGAVDALRGAEGLEVKSVASAPGIPTLPCPAPDPALDPTLLSTLTLTLTLTPSPSPSPPHPHPHPRLHSHSYPHSHPDPCPRPHPNPNPNPDPGDPLAQFSLRTSSVEMLAATASFYSDVLCMSEVGAPSETQRCFRYGALPGGALEGVPVTLVFRVEDGLVGDPASTQECFDHIAISCVDVDAASAHINGNEGGEAPLAPVILEPCDMFGTRIMGVSDPNGYKVYLVEEAGFRSG